MSLYSQFQTDTNLETTGVFLEYGLNSQRKPIRIKIARAGGANTAYTKRMEARAKPLRRQIQNDLLDTATADRLTLEVFCETVVLGWENVEDRKGNPLPFSYDNAVALFTDLPDLFRDVQEQAGRAALFRVAVREADAKN